MISVANAIEYAHRQGLIHRDLKPANVLVATIDGIPSPKVIDFGIARIITPDRDAPGTLAIVPSGTPAYMSPEQAMFEPVDGRADVYSLGVILLELLTRDRSTSDRSQKAIAALLNRHRVDPGLSAVVLKALQSEPSARYISPGELAADLQRIFDGQQPNARRRRSPALRHAITLVLSAALVLIGIVATRTLIYSEAIVVTPASVSWPEPSAATQVWRIAPEDNKGWWSTEIDTVSRRIYAVTTMKYLLEIDLDTGEVLRSTRPDGRKVVRCLLSKVRRNIVVITEDENGGDQRLLLLNEEGKVGKAVALEGHVFNACFVDSSDTILAVSRQLGETSRVDFYDLIAGRYLASGPTWNSPNAPTSMVSARDERSVVMVAPDGAVILIDARVGSTVATLGTSNSRTAVLDMIDDSHLAITGDQGATIYDIPARRAVLRLFAPHITARASSTVDGKFVLLGTIDQRIVRYDRKTGSPVGALLLGGDPSTLETAIAIPAEASYVVTSFDGSMRLMTEGKPTSLRAK